MECGGRSGIAAVVCGLWRGGCGLGQGKKRISALLTEVVQAGRMSALPPFTPQQFFAELFGSKAARDGEVIRRKVRDVERYIGRDVLLAETRRRGYPVVENAGQFVIFCNNEPIRRLS